MRVGLKHVARAAVAGVVFGTAALAGQGEAAAQTSRDVTGRNKRAVFCLFVSGPACLHSLSIDGVFAYQRSFNERTYDKDFFRLSGELGYYARIGRSALQLGPAVEAGGLFNDNADGWFLVPKLRFRGWPGYSAIGLEFSPGFVWEGQRDKATQTLTQRMGAHGEVGLSIFGAFTIFGAGQWLRSNEGQSAANAMVGARVLLPVAIEILAAIKR
ncbi:MAG: hypothetical protein IPK82_25475 [Polyangiaceae bacterium]|nr:hypothetical protein [Polyangiaceae bacterium]